VFESKKPQISAFQEKHLEVSKYCAPSVARALTLAVRFRGRHWRRQGRSGRPGSDRDGFLKHKLYFLFEPARGWANNPGSGEDIAVGAGDL
jgi:hypothetical protein